MSTNSKKTSNPVIELQRRKEVFRDYVRNLSPTEKILELEALQERSYEIMEIREQNGGLPIPDQWKRWHKAQLAIEK